MGYYDGLTERETNYIETAKKIGREKGNCKELSDLCHQAHTEYREKTISELAYGKIYATCVDYANPK